MEISRALQNKKDALTAIIAGRKKVCVAYSGGVDSTLLLKVAAEVLGDGAVAVMADGAMVPRSEVAEAITIAREIGAEPILLPMPVFDLADFTANGPRRCYYCKKFIFTAIQKEAARQGAKVIYDGSNLDDDRDYRPGHQALAELGVESPLRAAGFTKADIRALSRAYGLPTADKPAMACLATRVPTGTPITPEALAIIEAGEEQLKALGLAQYRLRLIGGQARVECLPQDFERVLAGREALINALKALGVKTLTLDLEGYGQGKMNAPKENE
jgi:uncharacterized protein